MARKGLGRNYKSKLRDVGVEVVDGSYRFGGRSSKCMVLRIPFLGDGGALGQPMAWEDLGAERVCRVDMVEAEVQALVRSPKTSQNDKRILKNTLAVAVRADGLLVATEGYRTNVDRGGTERLISLAGGGVQSLSQATRSRVFRGLDFADIDMANAHPRLLRRELDAIGKSLCGVRFYAESAPDEAVLAWVLGAGNSA